MKKSCMLFCVVLAFCSVFLASCGTNDSDELYKEPFVQFGASKSDVKSAWSSYSLMSETTDALVYLGRGNVEFYGYTFNNNILYGSMVILKSSTTLEDVLKFLEDRYQSIGMDGSYHMFMSNDGTMAVGAEYDIANKNVNVMYAEFPETKGSPVNTFSFVREKVSVR